MSLRILHLVSYSLYSGPVPATLGLALAQRRAGHRVWLAFDHKRGAFNDYEEAAAPRLAGLGLDPPAPLVLSAKSTLGELWRDWRALRRLVRAGDLDVVHVHLSHDHALCAASRPPPQILVVRTVHAERSLQARLGQGLLNRRVHAWIVRTQAHAELLAKGFTIRGPQVAVIPSGIDGAQFTPQSDARRQTARARFGIPAHAVVIGHVALIAGRGQEELAGALVRVNSERLHVLYVGRGEREAALRLLCQALGLVAKAHFSGYLRGAALLDAYAAMDVAFLAQAGNDAGGRAALEAMACGRPVIAVQTGALAEAVDVARGYPIPTRSPDHIAAALRGVLADTGEAARRGAAARAYVSAERSFAAEAAATVEHYERARPSVLASRQRGSR